VSSDDAETTVNESYAVTIPAAIRERVDVEPGDRVRWIVDGEDRLLAEIVRERYGAAEDIDPVDMGETDAVDVTESYDWS